MKLQALGISAPNCRFLSPPSPIILWLPVCLKVRVLVQYKHNKYRNDRIKGPAASSDERYEENQGSSKCIGYTRSKLKQHPVFFAGPRLLTMRLEILVLVFHGESLGVRVDEHI